MINRTGPVDAIEGQMRYKILCCFVDEKAVALTKELTMNNQQSFKYSNLQVWAQPWAVANILDRQNRLKKIILTKQSNLKSYLSEGMTDLATKTSSKCNLQQNHM